MKQNKYKYIKRILDILISSISIVVLSPMGLVVAYLIFIEDKHSPFYIANRIGKDGKIFRMYKFRSMRIDAEDLRNPDHTTFNSKDDTRVTKVGRVLRTTSLDELPQLFNVLTGDMSLVGPRPDLPDALDLYSDNDKKKLKVLPGITGYSQVEYRNTSTIRERFDGDVFYSDNYSLMMDLKIIFKTVIQVFGQKNIYRNS